MAEVRILSHMNKDHKLSVEDYLVVYGSVRLDHKISNVKMTEIRLTHFTLTFEHEDLEFPVEKIIPLEPPLGDLKEARVRLVEMAKFAAEKRGFSAFTIDTFRGPSLANWLTILVIYLPLLTTVVPQLLTNSTVSGLLGDSAVAWLLKNTWNVTYLTVGIHLLEALYIMKPKLDKFRVPMDFRFEWYTFVLIEGYPAVKRFNALVAEKEH